MSDLAAGLAAFMTRLTLPDLDQPGIYGCADNVHYVK
jgi:hypothetical protein